MDHLKISEFPTERQLILKYKQQLKGLEIRAKDRSACSSIAFINMENLSRALML
jgi:hypothetical protein